MVMGRREYRGDHIHGNTVGTGVMSHGVTVGMWSNADGNTAVKW